MIFSHCSLSDRPAEIAFALQIILLSNSVPNDHFAPGIIQRAKDTYEYHLLQTQYNAMQKLFPHFNSDEIYTKLKSGMAQRHSDNDKVLRQFLEDNHVHSNIAFNDAVEHEHLQNEYPENTPAYG